MTIVETWWVGDECVSREPIGEGYSKDEASAKVVEFAAEQTKSLGNRYPTGDFGWAFESPMSLNTVVEGEGFQVLYSIHEKW